MHPYSDMGMRALVGYRAKQGSYLAVRHGGQSLPQQLHACHKMLLLIMVANVAHDTAMAL